MSTHAPLWRIVHARPTKHQQQRYLLGRRRRDHPFRDRPGAIGPAHTYPFLPVLLLLRVVMMGRLAAVRVGMVVHRRVMLGLGAAAAVVVARRHQG